MANIYRAFIIISKGDVNICFQLCGLQISSNYELLECIKCTKDINRRQFKICNGFNYNSLKCWMRQNSKYNSGGKPHWRGADLNKNDVKQYK